MVKYVRFVIIGLTMSFCLAVIAPMVSYFETSAYAQDTSSGEEATVKPEKPDLASKPSECKSQKVGDDMMVPENCLFLEEPIGGKPNYDLFVVECHLNEGNKTICTYSLWGGEAIDSTKHGPVQAIVTRLKGNSEKNGMILLYSYLELIYRYFSGIIVGLVVLFIIIGGIQMTTSSGDTSKFDEGKKRIIRAITGMIFWFLASLILYTINPTFFAF
ncbi:hypothetical protein COY07_02405 [Candidatus Peregrinibacteria bacterium CG_4_10_14_0_2_um_filter_43_11]|nr:MAG: hypothetical protein COY07_02405 [Candidatus Peregrinibacteria bacterium CG_4_10_14_0_2_um_filter_43_11]